LNVYGYITSYDPEWAPNYIDGQNRYAFGKQAEIVKWNLERIADALTGKVYENDNEKDAKTWPKTGLACQGDGPCLNKWLDLDVAQKVLSSYTETYQFCFSERMRLRLGLPSEQTSEPDSLVKDFQHWLEESKVDYHLASRALGEVPILVASNGNTRATDADLKNAAGQIVRRSALEATPCVELATEGLATWLYNYTDVLLKKSTAGDEAALEEQRSWQVRWHAPKYILRSDVLLNVTRAAAKTSRGDIIQVAESIIRHPFGAEETAPTPASVLPAFLQHDVPEEVDLEDASVEQVEQMLQTRMSALPTSEANSKTSCGAQ